MELNSFFKSFYQYKPNYKIYLCFYKIIKTQEMLITIHENSKFLTMRFFKMKKPPNRINAHNLCCEKLNVHKFMCYYFSLKEKYKREIHGYVDIEGLELINNEIYIHK